MVEGTDEVSNVVSPMSLLCVDIIGVIASFVPAATQPQRVLMLVNKTWCEGVVHQDGLEPKPGVSWPWHALDERCSRRVRLSGGSDGEIAALVAEDASPDCVESLRLMCCPSVTDKGLSILHFSTFAQQLSELHFDQCENVGNSGLWHISALDALTTLTLHQCTKITDEGITHISKMKDLTSLKISGVSSRLSDNGVQVLVRGPLAQATATPPLVRKNLKQLVLQDARKLTDRCMYHIAVLEALEILNLSGCSQLTDVGIQTLCNASCSKKSLHTVELGDLTNLTDVGAGSLSQFPNLRTLCLKECRRVGDDGLRPILSECQWLKELDVTRCGITNYTLEFISCTSRYLTRLNLSRCPSITADGLRFLSYCSSSSFSNSNPTCSDRRTSSSSTITATNSGSGGSEDSSAQHTASAISTEEPKKSLCCRPHGCVPPPITHLTLAFMPSLDDTRLHYVSKIATLTHLHLAYCDKLSAQGLLSCFSESNDDEPRTLNASSKIVSVDVVDCDKIDNAVCERLRALRGASCF